MIARKTPLKRSGPPRKKRPGPPRRGQPTKAEKEAIRIAARARADARCELKLHKECSGPRELPLDGGLYERGHLVHLRGKRRFGWREGNGQVLLWGCGFCHLISMHRQGVIPVVPDRPLLKV
jgi:hypothetical protein